MELRWPRSRWRATVTRDDERWHALSHKELLRRGAHWTRDSRGALQNRSRARGISALGNGRAITGPYGRASSGYDVSLAASAGGSSRTTKRRPPHLGQHGSCGGSTASLALRSDLKESRIKRIQNMVFNPLACLGTANGYRGLQGARLPSIVVW